jgi:RecA-family ATPase/DNA polymerase I-like protein with 3'-5' exonuclease and polymerase domains
LIGPQLDARPFSGGHQNAITKILTMSELPDLRHIDVAALDTETNDEGLRADRGSAWPWQGGYICGISVAYRADGNIRAHYFPLRHPASENFDPAQVFAWLKDLIASDVRIVTQNGLYDWGWLRSDGGVLMPPSDRLEEIGALATLIDENRFSYSLDKLCEWRGLPGKDTALLHEAIKTAGWALHKRSINVAEYIHRLPAHLVGPYAEADAAATLALFEDLNPILDREGTRDAYRLEVDLLPMVHEMRRRGIRIDQGAAEQARDLILQKRDAALAELSDKLGAATGMDEISSPKWKARTFDAHKISYPRTPKGNPSFKAGKTGWMAGHPHWLPQLIATANKYEAAGTKFLETHILNHIIDGRVYAEINPHRSDNGGTRSFRFSYSNPPLQQMPARDEELAPLIRSVFLPEEGEIWCQPDISQQEFRFVVHHAFKRNLPGASAAVERYRNDPDTDFHALASEITGISRADAKHVNFAKIYGAGVKKFAEMIHKPLSEAQTIYGQYDRRLPFVPRLATVCQLEAHRSGHTLLYDGARRHWDRWAPRSYTKDAAPCSLEEAKRRTLDPGHPWYDQELRRVDIHTALNALIQGSAARHTKLWMRACWRERIVPLLQMHDALDCSVTTREQGELIARLGCEAVALEVPMRADLKFGKSWGDATHRWDELHGIATPMAATEIASKMPNDSDFRTGELPTGSRSDHNLAAAEDDAADELPPQPSTPESAHVCAQCHLDPPDGCERPSAYNDLWLHARCEDAFISARMAEEGLWRNPARDKEPPPEEKKPTGGNGYSNDYRGGGEREEPFTGNTDAREYVHHSSDGHVHGDVGPKRGRRTAQWFYPHLDRSNYLRVDRYDNGERKFYQHHWDGERWVHGVKGTYAERKIPYRLPELKKALQANPDVEVQICEGESDADALAQLGFVVTTNPGGALSWTPELTSWLRVLGVHRAVIHEDNDDAAHDHKGPKRSALLTKELSDFIKLKIVRYPDVPESEDVRWWLKYHTKEELEARIAAAEPAALPFPFINMSNWDSEPVPEQQWIVPGRIPRRQSVIFSGEGGAGKSIILLHLSAVTALGRDWLGATPEQGPAFFIDCEDDTDVMHYRLAAIARHSDTCFTDLINGGLHLTSLVGQDTVMATVSRSGIVEPTMLYNRLLQAAGDIKPNIIGIAASANVFAGDENTRTQVQQFINLTTRLAIAANGALVLITHPSLTGINTGTGLSGTTQWHNAVRARFYLKGVKAEPGEQPDNDLREIEFKKNQYGAMAENIPLRWQDGLYLPMDGVTLDRAEQEARADDIFLELLRRFTAQNRYVSSSLGPTYAPALFAKEDTARKAGINSASLAAAMRRLFEAEKIYNEQHGKPSRPRFHLAAKP